MSSKTILVVDDEWEILELVRYNLVRGGYKVNCTQSGEYALRLAKSVMPDLILLDVILPGLDGFELCKRLKAERQTADTPIIMISAKSEDADVVAGLELGADDYIIKPFSPRVLLARVRAALRRREVPNETESAVIQRSELVIDPARHQVTADGQPVMLTTLEMRILTILARRPGLVLTRYQIIDASQGEGMGVTDRSVDVHIFALRQKLGVLGTLIETVRGIGYRFKEL